MPDIDKLSKRPMEYMWETGVAPLSVGSAFLLLGTADLLQRFLPQTDQAQQVIRWLGLGGVVAVLCGAQFIKTRLVFPRGGYVDYKGPEWNASMARWTLFFFLPIVFGPLIIAYAITPDGSWRDHDFLDERLEVPGFAVLIGVLTLYHGRKRKMPLLYGIYMMCLALPIWWLPLSTMERYNLLQLGAAGPLAVLGAMRLRAFLKANPKPVDLTTGG